MSHKKHTALIAGLVIAAALAAGYVVGANYYGTKRFLMHTTYNGVSTKGKSSVGIEEEAKQKLLSRSITIKERNDKTETIDLSSVASSVTFETSPDQYLKEQNAWTWPLSLFKTTALTSKYTVALDTDKLASAVNSLTAVTSTDVTAPQDATIVLGSDGFTIQDEVEGDQINTDALLSAIESAVQDDSLTVDADKENCYNEPSVTSDSADLKSEVDSLNALKSETITIDLTGATETLGWDTFSSWLSYADGAVNVNSDSLAAYVSDLASKYDTFQTTRSFTTTLDGVQSVGMGDYDSYGFEMDQDQTASLIAQTITAGQSTTIQPVWTYTAVQRTGTNEDIGSTYVEVSLTRQHVWYYKDGVLQMESDCVSGLPTADRQTYKGVYQILKKATNYTMKGSYGSQWCQYFMLFNYAGQALHSAQWRSSFGGTIYQSSGSHGCVNLPVSFAGELYNAISEGTPVVVY